MGLLGKNGRNVGKQEIRSLHGLHLLAEHSGAVHSGLWIRWRLAMVCVVGGGLMSTGGRHANQLSVNRTADRSGSRLGPATARMVFVTNHKLSEILQQAIAGQPGNVTQTLCGPCGPWEMWKTV